MTHVEEILRAVRSRGYAWRADDVRDRLCEWAALMAWIEPELTAPMEIGDNSDDQVLTQADETDLLQRAIEMIIKRS